MAGETNVTSIDVTRTNNITSSAVANGSVNNTSEISQCFIDTNGLSGVVLSDVDSVIIPKGTETVADDQTVEYDTLDWEETVKANITIGEAAVNGDNGKHSFNTATYIQTDTSSCMYPVEAVAYLMSNLSIGDVTTTTSDDGKSVTVKYGDKKIKFEASSDKLSIDGTEKTADNGAVCEITDGKLFIPLRAFAKAIDCKVEWVADGKVVNLEKTFQRKSLVKQLKSVETTTETTTESTTELIITRRPYICGNSLTQYISRTYDDYFADCSCSYTCTCKAIINGKFGSCVSVISSKPFASCSYNCTCTPCSKKNKGV
jgi:hypothetical protein